MSALRCPQPREEPLDACRLAQQPKSPAHDLRHSVHLPIHIAGFEIGGALLALAATLCTAQSLVLRTSPTNLRDNTIRQKSSSWESRIGCSKGTASASFSFRETTTFPTTRFLAHLSRFQSPPVLSPNCFSTAQSCAGHSPTYVFTGLPTRPAMPPACVLSQRRMAISIRVAGNSR